MSAEQRDQQEPSMEEILSSIRRIIADEEAEEDRPAARREAGAAAAHEDETEDQDEDDEDVLELTRVVRDSGDVVDLQGGAPAEDEEEHEEDDEEEEPAAPPGLAPAAGEAETDDDIEATPVDHEPAPEPVEPLVRQETTSVPPSSATQELLSDSAASAATGAFAKFSRAIQRTPEEESVADGSGRSVEQFIEDMIRPMLKAWLDENMPPLVERLVEKEIQKLARRSELM